MRGIRPYLPLARPARVLALPAVVVAAVACGAPSPPLPRLDARATRAIEGLEGATALALLPDGRIAIAEPDGSGEGRVRLFDPRRPTAAAILVATPSPGPTAMAVDPDFPSNRRLWWVRGASMVAIEVEGSDSGSMTPVAMVEVPGVTGSIDLGPDGRVYVGIVRGALTAAVDRGRRRSGGAILRLNPEGTVPADNPRGPSDPVWASGLATPVGLDFDPAGTAWVADSAAGRVARLRAGDDAGWPLVRGRLDDPLERIAAREIGPAFRPATWAPDRGAPIAVSTLRSPAWGATVAVGLDDGRVVRIRVEGTGEAGAGVPGEASGEAGLGSPGAPGEGRSVGNVRSGPLAGPLDGPVVDLAEGPDGRLWALTPSTIWRIDPPGAAPFDEREVRADTVAPAPGSY